MTHRQLAREEMLEKGVHQNKPLPINEYADNHTSAIITFKKT